ncbi:MAG TPA: hypothetical protein VGH85_23200 [Mycobacteriales bacterium]
MTTKSATAPDIDLASRRRWKRAVALVYYLGLCLLLGLIISKTLTDIIPGTVGKHIGYDSEGYVLALILPLWIEFVRPRIAGRSSEWIVTGAGALVMFGLFLWFYNSNILSTVKTLNETLFALAFLIPYVQFIRRPSKYVAGGCALAVFILLLIFDHTSLVRFPTNLAEGVVMMILAPIAFDITDRGILTPDRPSPLRVRQAWWALLVILPLLFIALHHAHFGGTLGDAVRYAVRPQEAFVGMFGLEIYFAIRMSRWLNPRS